MAQTILLPVEFTFSSERANWVVGTINLRSWWLGYDSVLEASISAPPEYQGVIELVKVDHLPSSLRQELPPGGKRLAEKIRRVAVEVLFCLPASEKSDYMKPEYMKIDPWRSRDEFLSLRRSTTDLLRFLNKYGAWARGKEPRYNLLKGWEPQMVLPGTIWSEQDRIRGVLERGPRDWFGSWQSSLSLNPRPEFPHYDHSDNLCLEAIYTSITVDFLRGVHFRICARKDCGKPFAAERKGKRYCEQYCAHLVSVRRTRKRQASKKGD
jgi:hypothetical protein